MKAPPLRAWLHEDRVASFEHLQVTRLGRVLTITLSRPNQLNASNAKLHSELPEASAFAATDTQADVIVVTGAGRASSAAATSNGRKPPRR